MNLRFVLTGFLLALFAMPALAGNFVYATKSGTYVPKTVVQGQGATQDAAVQDATAAMPGGWALSPTEDWTYDQMTTDIVVATRPIIHECLEE